MAASRPDSNLTEEERKLIQQLLADSGLSSSAYEEPASDIRTTRGVDSVTGRPITEDVTVSAERDPAEQQPRPVEPRGEAQYVSPDEPIIKGEPYVEPPASKPPTQTGYVKEDRTLIPPKYLDLPADEANDVISVLGSGRGKNTVQLKDGSVVTQDGTIAARANNPGNLEYGKLAQEYGATGMDSNRFAVFPDKKDGLAALRHWWEVKYPDTPIKQAMHTYAPGIENDTAGYTKFLANGIGDGSTFAKLTPKQKDTVINRIAQFEGANKPVSKTTVIPPASAQGTPATPMPMPMPGAPKSNKRNLPVNFKELSKALRYRESVQGLRDEANREYDKFYNNSPSKQQATGTSQQVNPEDTGFSNIVLPGEGGVIPPVEPNDVPKYTDAGGGMFQSSLAAGGNPKAKAKAKVQQQPQQPQQPQQTTTVVKELTPEQQYAPLLETGVKTTHVADSVANDNRKWENMKSPENQYNRMIDEQIKKNGGVVPKKKPKPSTNWKEMQPTTPPPPQGTSPMPADTSSGSTSTPTPMPADTSGGRTSGALLPTTLGLIGLNKEITKQNSMTGLLVDLNSMSPDTNDWEQLSQRRSPGGKARAFPLQKPTGKTLHDKKNPLLINKTTVGAVNDLLSRSGGIADSLLPAPAAPTTAAEDPARDRENGRQVKNSIIFNWRTGDWEEWSEVSPGSPIRISKTLADFMNTTDTSNVQTIEAAQDLTNGFNTEAFEQEDPDGFVVTLAPEGVRADGTGAPTATGSTIIPPSNYLTGKQVRILPVSFTINYEDKDINMSRTSMSESGIPVVVSRRTGQYEPYPAAAAKNWQLFGLLSGAQQYKYLQVLAEQYDLTPVSVAKKLTTSDAEVLNTLTKEQILRDPDKFVIYQNALRDQYIKKYIGKDGNEKNIAALQTVLDHYASQVSSGQLTPAQAAQQTQNTLNALLQGLKPLPNGQRSALGSALIRRGGSFGITGGNSRSQKMYQGADDSAATLISKSELNAIAQTIREIAAANINNQHYGEKSRATFEKLFGMSWLWRTISSDGEGYERNLAAAKKFDTEHGNIGFTSGVPDAVAFGRILEFVNPANLMGISSDWKMMTERERVALDRRLDYARQFYNIWLDPVEDERNPKEEEKMLAFAPIVEGSPSWTQVGLRTPTMQSSESSSDGGGAKVDINAPPSAPPHIPPVKNPVMLSTQTTSGAVIGSDPMLAPHNAKIGTSIGIKKGRPGIEEYNNANKVALSQVWGNKVPFDTAIRQVYTEFWNKVRDIPDRAAKAPQFAAMFGTIMGTEYGKQLNDRPEFKGKKDKICNEICKDVIGGGATTGSIANALKTIYPSFDSSNLDATRAILMGETSSIDAGTINAQFGGENPTEIVAKLYAKLASGGAGSNNLTQLAGNVKGTATSWSLPAQFQNLSPAAASTASARAFFSTLGVSPSNAMTKDSSYYNQDYWEGNCGKNQGKLENDIASTINGLIFSRCSLDDFK